MIQIGIENIAKGVTTEIGTGTGTGREIESAVGVRTTKEMSTAERDSIKAAMMTTTEFRMRPQMMKRHRFM